MRTFTMIGALALTLFAGSLSAETFPAGGPATTNNDDSCDIALLPAATLLLPYFEVDLDDRNGETTLLTITNVTDTEQIANVTLWTDYGFPVVDFFVYLTGYDTQSLNLYDVIGRGIIASEIGTGTDVSPMGEYSRPNPMLDLDLCDQRPGQLPDVYLRRMQDALRKGSVAAFGSAPQCETVGSTHQNAVGYATIDLVRDCGSALPTYRPFVDTLRFDNALTGDFQQIHAGNNYAQSNPLVHIRAIPEGGDSYSRIGSDYEVNFNGTFYSRYLNGGTGDARQPLPSRFVARWINGGPGSYQTYFKIWREGKGSTTTCAGWPLNGGQLPISEITMFDEEENPYMVAGQRTLPSTSMTSVADTTIFPPNPGGFVSGWMYFNLDSDGTDMTTSHNWVVTSMRAEGRFSNDQDATALGNACSPPFGPSEIHTPNGPVIAPSANVF